ncbi:NUDIX domain-containing protein [Candidatus Magnetaquicoccus inordinatus]|uniref:NUDIX domain-containing protein n=1 Tax=Candidatus Magnetaquicoccus inordinatus TaxID=2496818 RepID=UPI00102AAEA3|nr:NUDIX hydrolase [Candidatus Magnetaquicoccus inordinatus]
MFTIQTPHLVTDIIIELLDLPDRPIVLIERKYPPYGLAIPGGFVDVGERVEQAALREAAEETTLQVSLQALLGLYSDPTRDSRSHTVSAVYVAQAHGMPVAADDAKNVRIVSLSELPLPMAFDHATILSDYLLFRSTGSVTPLRFG